MAFEIFQNKKLDEMDFSDIQLIVNNQIPESYDLEYKENYPQKNKLPKLMIAFANAMGGYIILGIKEKREKDLKTGKSINTGIPEKIVGINRADHRLKITQILMSHSQPKIFPNVHIIPHQDEPHKDIVIIKINEAFEPIMFYDAHDKDTNKYFIRINDGKIVADQPMLKKLFSGKSIQDKIKIFEEEVANNQIILFEKLRNQKPGDRYILIGFSVFLFSNDLNIIDTNDIDTEEYIKNLNYSLNFEMPERLRNFSHYMRDFEYMGDSFVSKSEYRSEQQPYSSDFRIYRNGQMWGAIIYKTRKGSEILENSNSLELEPNDNKKIIHSGYFYRENLPVFIIIILRFIQLIYKERFQGRFKISFRIYTTSHKILFNLNDFNLKISNKNDIILQRSLYCHDLDDIANIKQFVNDFLKEFLRYFGYDLKTVGQEVVVFKKIIEDCINVVFKK